MAFNGSGTFSRLYSWAADAANSIKIRADRMDAEFDGIAEGLSKCILRDGTGKPSADIDWNGHKLTNLAAGAAATDAVNKTQMETAITASGDAAANALATETTNRTTADTGLQNQITAINARTWATWQPTAATAPGGNIFGAMTAQQGDASSLVSGGSVVVPAAGAYSFKILGSAAAGTMGFSLYVNATLVRSTNNVNYTGQSHITMEFQESLSASDSVQIWVSGAATVNFTGTQVFVARVR